MNLKTAFIGLAGVLAIPAAINILGIDKDMELGQSVTDKLAGKATEVATAPEKKADTPEIKDLPGLAKFKLDEYKPKQP